MIRIYKDTKIYIQCPAGAVTGGAELLHQCVDFLRKRNLDAYIVYFGNKEKVIPTDYKKYNIKMSLHIEQEPHNISILYEPLFNQVLDETPIQKILWWLSVDNFYTSGAYFLPFGDLKRYSYGIALKTIFRRLGKLIIRGENDFSKTVSIKDLANSNVLSCYQSEYAHNFLLNNGFKEMVALKDYINDEHIKPIKKDGRQNIVLYNPKKGAVFTKELIKMAPDIHWKPIENMPRKEVIKCMQTSKLYIDFGHHPGKDRLPRECAMNGLCVITGLNGSARYFEDVWLENKYKFDNKTSKVQIINLIREILDNYENEVDNFAYYRNQITNEKKEFINQLENIFCNPALFVE